MFKKTTAWIKENKETVLTVTLVTICGAAMVYAGHQIKTLSKSATLEDDDLCLLTASRQAMEDLVSGERTKYPIFDVPTNRAFELTYFGPLSTYEV